MCETSIWLIDNNKGPSWNLRGGHPLSPSIDLLTLDPGHSSGAVWEALEAQSSSWCPPLPQPGPKQIPFIKSKN